jgi:hypothetical protein
VGLGNPQHKPYSEHEDVLLTIGECIFWTREGTLQQLAITKKMSLADNRD